MALPSVCMIGAGSSGIAAVKALHARGFALDCFGASGEIAPKPNIAELTERTVRFADGSEVEADVVVYCTGYKVTFPFFDRDLVAAPGNDLQLLRRVFHPDVGDVFFVGLLQPLGAVMPLAELRPELVGDHLAGRYVLAARRVRRAGARRAARAGHRLPVAPRAGAVAA